MTYQVNRDDMLPFYEDENAAIHRHDPDAARAACVGRSYLMAQTMLAELCRRRVFAAPETFEIDIPGHLRVVAGADAARTEPSLVL